MDENATKNVIEAALLAAGRPLTFDRIVEIFARKGVDVDRGELRAAIESLANDYNGRGIELKEVASGFRVQVRSSVRDWLEPLFEERAPRYTRALLETLALVAYRQPITRAEIEEIRGVAVSSNIIRTLVERGWVRVVGHRDVPGKPSMLGTTREFLDYFGLKRLEDLPPLSELRDLEPGTNLQSDLIDRLEERVAVAAAAEIGDAEAVEDDESGVVAGEVNPAEPAAGEEASTESAEADAGVGAGDSAESEVNAEIPDSDAAGLESADSTDVDAEAEVESARSVGKDTEVEFAESDGREADAESVDAGADDTELVEAQVRRAES